MSIIADFTANGEEILQRSSAVVPQSARTKKASPKGGVKDAGASLSVSYRKDYLASALTLRARRDFLRAAQFLWYTWFAAAWSIVLQASVRRDFASSAFPASTASRTRREAVRTRDFSAAFFAWRFASDFTLRIEALMFGK